ncbi:MAG: hypothetical protein K1X79_06925 [Oligoflexia bacterium]|nr:hypothetical protein [Oligoflexia bacterium]
MLQDLLVGQRLHPKVIARMMCGVSFEEEASKPAERVVAGRLSDLLRFDARISAKRRILEFVGPNGAGKTTLIAKLASRLKEAFNLRVAMVGVESRNLAQGFHLGTFGSLTGIAFHAVERADYMRGTPAYRRMLTACDEADVVLIDSDGRTAVPDVRREETESIMVLPAPWRSDELVETMKRYESTGYSRLAVSKLDCCGFAGPLIDALLSVDKPLAFFSCGPRVPQDLEPASARRLGRMLTQVLH